jgi:hypothetical protein
MRGFRRKGVEEIKSIDASSRESEPIDQQSNALIWPETFIGLITKISIKVLSDT